MITLGLKQKIRQIVYHLELPVSLKLYDVFHVSTVEPGHFRLLELKRSQWWIRKPARVIVDWDRIKWDFLQGREEEATAVPRRITPRTEHKTIDFCRLNQALKEESSKLKVTLPFKRFARNRWALKHVMGLLVLVFGIGTVYYDIPLGLPYYVQCLVATSFLLRK